MTDVKSDKTTSGWSRRDVLKATSVGAAGAATPMFFTKNAWADGHESIGNYPVRVVKLYLVLTYLKLAPTPMKVLMNCVHTS